jgi:hypothetical protein
MSEVTISNRTELIALIKVLNEEKDKQEAELKKAFEEFAETLNPVNKVKDYLHKLADDREVLNDVLKVAVNFGAGFLINKVAGNRNSLKGFIGTLLADKFLSNFITSNLPKLFSKVSKLIREKAKPETDN